MTSAVGGAGGVKGIEGHTVSYCFKSLVTRFVDALKEIRTHDNIVNYTCSLCIEMYDSIAGL